MTDQLTHQTVELLQTLIRNECVNDGSADSGQEIRNADVLQTWLEGSGLDVQRYEPTPRPHLAGRTDRGERPEGEEALPHGAHRRRPGESQRLDQ